MAPVTEAAIVAHGQPGDPTPLQRDLEALAARVEALLPGWRIHGATLADAASLARLHGVRLIYPLFMAAGWFTGTEVPRRLEAAGVKGFAMLRPLGLDPALPTIGAALARETAAAAGLDPAVVTLVVVGHGSQVSRGSARATRAFAAALCVRGWARIETGFIEEAPFLGALRPAGPAVCLPFFAIAASHTIEDIPAAWAALGAPGPIAPAIGTAAAVPAVIAASLQAALREAA